jgi:hypothetical protein
MPAASIELDKCKCGRPHDGWPGDDGGELCQDCWESECSESYWRELGKLEAIMPQHYTRATTEVSVYCNRCRKETMHRVDDRKRGPCLECLARLENLADERKRKPDPKPQPKQGGLFE